MLLCKQLSSHCSKKLSGVNVLKDTVKQVVELLSISRGKPKQSKQKKMEKRQSNKQTNYTYPKIVNPLLESKYTISVEISMTVIFQFGNKDHLYLQTVFSFRRNVVYYLLKCIHPELHKIKCLLNRNKRIQATFASFKPTQIAKLRRILQHCHFSRAVTRASSICHAVLELSVNYSLVAVTLKYYTFQRNVKVASCWPLSFNKLCFFAHCHTTKVQVELICASQSAFSNNHQNIHPAHLHRLQEACEYRKPEYALAQPLLEAGNAAEDPSYNSTLPFHSTTNVSTWLHFT